MRKVLFLDSCHPSLPEYLEKAGYTVLYKPGLSHDEFEHLLPDVFGIILRSRFIITKEVITKARCLKFIGRVGSGMENIDQAACQSAGVRCFNSPEGNRQAVAEHCLGLLLGLSKNIARSNREVQNGIWAREANRGMELEHKTIGIIGYGNTGSSFARVLRGLSMKILAYDKYKSDFGDAEVIECGIDRIFEESDILSLHIPYNDETHYLVNEVFLGRFRKPIYLINTSRGSIVDTSALLRMMKAGRVLKAGLDVIEYEDYSFESFFKRPLPDIFQELQNHPDIILTPHIGGWTVESNEKLSMILADKIINSF